MPSLWKIDQAIMSCIDFETGEIIDLDALETLSMLREEKIENVALWIKNLAAEAVAYDAEAKAFAERKKKALEKIEQLKRFLAKATNGQDFSTTKCAVSFRTSKRVEVFNADAIPKAFLTEKIEYSPNKSAIKKAIESGQAVNGCALIEHTNTTIK